MKRVIILLTVVFSVCCFSTSFAQLEELKKMLGGLPGAGNTEKELAESINWKPLSKLLPESIAGFESSKLEGGTFKTVSPTSPTEQYSYSSVMKSYSNKGKRIKITIMDSGYNQLLMAPFMMSYEFDGPEGYMKSTKVGDHNAKEMVELDGEKVTAANIMVTVNGRVLVMFEGSGGVSVDEIKKQADKMDYGKIKSLIKSSEKISIDTKE